MSDSFLEKLKKSVLAGAHTSATKIEEAARTGKLHLDLMAERRKLTREFTELGKEAHAALVNDSLGEFGLRAQIIEMQKNIARYQKAIGDLETKLAESKPKAK